ncbi:hypothetical protein B0J13DRAFT_460669, partial [Dactylonectria estremocensis]
IFKLGRYAIAARALLQLASEVPSLFSPMLVEPVTAPPRTQFGFSQGEMPLTYVLRRIVGSREEEYVSRLVRVWNVLDPETHFRNACSLNLSVHAEVQLISFYDQYPERKPALRFVGVSKKSCFLCVAKLELESRLGHRRRVPLESTAGVSLSGLTDTNSARGAQGGLGIVHTAVASEGDHSFTVSSPQPIDIVDFTPQDEDRGRDRAEASLLWTLNPSPTMVFHIMRAGDVKTQDKAKRDMCNLPTMPTAE